MGRARIGIFGIGLAAYWDQFPALKDRLTGYQRFIEERIGARAEVVSAGLVDTAYRAREAADRFSREDLDLVVCYVGTYATSSQVLPVVQGRPQPVLLLNLQPTASLDYARTGTGEWLANCCACSVPEISGVFRRARVDYAVVSGLLGMEAGYADSLADENTADHPAAKAAWREIGEWVDAAAAARGLRRARVGFLGHTYPGMLDLYSDFTQHHAQVGNHIEVLEMCDLDRAVDEVTGGDLAAKRKEVEEVFEISEDSPSDPLAKKPGPEEMEWACRVAAGLDRLAERYSLDALTYYYRGLEGNRYERLGAGVILGCSLLTARGIPCSGEGDLKNCQAMKLMDLLGAGGSYTELYAMDFDEGFVLMGHDGPFHPTIAEGKPILRGLGLYHGKRGYGVGVEARVRNGPVTVLGMTQTADGNLKLLAAEGETVPGEVLRIGNTNSRVKFPVPPVDFMNRWTEQGPTHHVALGVGHRTGRIEKAARLLGIELVKVI